MIYILTRINLILLILILLATPVLAQKKLKASLRVGAGAVLNTGIDGVGFNMELPIQACKYFEFSPSVSYARIKPNYETDYKQQVYLQNSTNNSISYGGRTYQLGNSNFFTSSNSQFGLDLNVRFKPLSFLSKQLPFDIALGIGYGYKSGMDILENSSDNGNYWIAHRSWNSMEWNPFLLDVNYQLNKKHKLGVHFNIYGGNDHISQLGFHFITCL
ncbi:hypothetical protein [Marinifilum caeruleilacunae]|uniref:Outer membrane protein beta-barrel domain-containing protein n=1 Tax=Marinifilum caeruleilacunae TaxID=2499076 RepID=A0ABX1WZP9_9BACT|nr:hypothetical protein [Marinifilum caeruleilacunae]NOU61600.1 hypothetical protein [Marinifilum caeruleilacunae]